nr:MAG TPA: hypothetical protein [Caudoviricetes sp.]
MTNVNESTSIIYTRKSPNANGDFFFTKIF